MNAHAVSFARAIPQQRRALRKQLFVVVTLLIVCGAIFRSAVATRLDGFTLDEAYHIAAGVSYVREMDFRINPEHPPYAGLKVDWLGRDFQRDESRIESADFSGTVMVNARLLAKMPLWDTASLRDRVPDARFGNLLIFRGPCSCESLRAQLVYNDAVARIYSEAPDLPGAERLLRESIRLDPSPFFAYIDLGNLLLKRGTRKDALRTYSEALKRVPGNPEISRAIEEQIARVSSEPLDRIPELRDPFLE